MRKLQLKQASLVLPNISVIALVPTGRSDQVLESLLGLLDQYPIVASEVNRQPEHIMETRASVL